MLANIKYKNHDFSKFKILQKFHSLEENFDFEGFLDSFIN